MADSTAGGDADAGEGSAERIRTKIGQLIREKWVCKSLYREILSEGTRVVLETVCGLSREWTGEPRLARLAERVLGRYVRGMDSSEYLEPIRRVLYSFCSHTAAGSERVQAVGICRCLMGWDGGATVRAVEEGLGGRTGDGLEEAGTVGVVFAMAEAGFLSEWWPFLERLSRAPEKHKNVLFCRAVELLWPRMGARTGAISRELANMLRKRELVNTVCNTLSKLDMRIEDDGVTADELIKLYYLTNNIDILRAVSYIERDGDDIVGMIVDRSGIGLDQLIILKNVERTDCSQRLFEKLLPRIFGAVRPAGESSGPWKINRPANNTSSAGIEPDGLDEVNNNRKLVKLLVLKYPSEKTIGYFTSHHDIVLGLLLSEGGQALMKSATADAQALLSGGIVEHIENNTQCVIKHLEALYLLLLPEHREKLLALLICKLPLGSGLGYRKALVRLARYSDRLETVEGVLWEELSACVRLDTLSSGYKRLKMDSHLDSSSSADSVLNRAIYSMDDQADCVDILRSVWPVRRFRSDEDVFRLLVPFLSVRSRSCLNSVLGFLGLLDYRRMETVKTGELRRVLRTLMHILKTAVFSYEAAACSDAICAIFERLGPQPLASLVRLDSENQKERRNMCNMLVRLYRRHAVFISSILCADFAVGTLRLRTSVLRIISRLDGLRYEQLLVPMIEDGATSGDAQLIGQAIMAATNIVRRTERDEVPAHLLNLLWHFILDVEVRRNFDQFVEAVAERLGRGPFDRYLATGLLHPAKHVSRRYSEIEAKIRAKQGGEDEKCEERVV